VIVLDTSSQCQDFFNALVLWKAEDYPPYVHQFLDNYSLSEDSDEATRTLIVAEVDKYMLEDGVLHRKVKEGTGLRIVRVSLTSRHKSDRDFSDLVIFGHSELS